jgi:hypothetical protein
MTNLDLTSHLTVASPCICLQDVPPTPYVLPKDGILVKYSGTVRSDV